MTEGKSGFIKIRRALLSVSDKTNLVDLAKVLSKLGVEIISTGGTQAKLKEAKPMLPVEQVVGALLDVSA